MKNSKTVFSITLIFILLLFSVLPQFTFAFYEINLKLNDLATYNIAKNIDEILSGIDSKKGHWRPYGGGTKQILTLADGFLPGTQDLAFEIFRNSPIIETKSTVYKTGIDCPKEYKKEVHDSKVSEKETFHAVYVDHQKELPFSTNFAHTVVMRKGLCICKGLKKRTLTCGGISLNGSSDKHFFFEVARILNKQENDAFALLQGSHLGLALEDFQRAIQTLADIRRVLQKIESSFPNMYIYLLKNTYSLKEFTQLRMEQRKENFLMEEHYEDLRIPDTEKFYSNLDIFFGVIFTQKPIPDSL